jgi:hypothetical protein
VTLSLLCLEVRAVGMCKTFVTNRLHSSPHFVDTYAHIMHTTTRLWLTYPLRCRGYCVSTAV